MPNTTINNVRIPLKNDTAANWQSSSLILLAAEVAHESDTNKFKFGDGVSAYSALPYATLTPDEITALIASGSINDINLSGGSTNGTLKLTVDTKVTDNIKVTGLDTAAYQPSSAFATAAQGTLANNAVRSVVTGTANGTISVTTGVGAATNVAVRGLASAAYKTAGANEGNVPVNGASLGTTKNVPVVTDTGGNLIPHASGALGSAAFANASSFATAAQGTLADNAVRSVATGTANGTISVTTGAGAATNIPIKGLGSAAYTASTAYATAAQGTKADAAMPRSGGTFTGFITLNATPTDGMHAATKGYVDSKINEGIAASDAMIFKGTIGTDGTITALPTTFKTGDTYKAISAVTVASTASYTGSESPAKVGDLIVAMSNGKWLVVPSGDERETAIRYATSGVTLSDSYQTGSITLGTAATHQVDTAITAGSASINLATSAAIAKFVENKGYVTTDEKVKNVLATTTKAYITGTASAATNTGTQVFDTGVYLDTTAGTLTATTFNGALSGNAATATILKTARTIALSGGVTGTATSFNGSAGISIPVTAINTDYLVSGNNTLILNCGGAA